MCGTGADRGREDPGDLIDIDGWALLFHPQLIAGTYLEKEMRQFSYFDYSANEALFLQEDEREIIVNLIKDIRAEIYKPLDNEQNAIIISYISAILHLCNRAYSRQFSRIRRSSDDILVKLSALLNEYFDSGAQLAHGIPGVQYFAEKLCMSPNYFSDLLKKTTGENASNFIREHIIRIAKTGFWHRVIYRKWHTTLVLNIRNTSAVCSRNIPHDPSQYMASL